MLAVPYVLAPPRAGRPSARAVMAPGPLTADERAAMPPGPHAIAAPGRGARWLARGLRAAFVVARWIAIEQGGRARSRP
jgi:hypothetical protein